MERESFGSKIGMVLATAGSAVGLGNVWRFPYMAGHDGGAAFILIYISCVLVLGIPGIISEFIVGRHSAANAARAYRKISHGGPGGVIGYIGIFTSMIILGFYAVVAGWCLQYLFAFIFGQIHGNVQEVNAYFQSFSTDPIRPLFWTIAFILLTHFVVIKGVRNGLEKASNVMMPVLFLMLILIVVASCLLPHASKGIAFLFKPDFQKLTPHILFDALGQAFFSLSLGSACLCTYASYFNKQSKLSVSAFQIALIDTAIAVLAGLMIFPAAFSVGVSPDSGPALIFLTLPNVFQKAFGSVPVIGYIIGILFYALLSLAALTSTISMHEIGTSFFYEEFHLTRKQGAWIETVICCIIGVFCSLSNGAVSSFKLLGMSFFDFCNNLTSDILLPLVSFLTCILVGWFVPKKIIKEEYTNWGTLKGRTFNIYYFAVRIVCPLCILVIFLHQLGVI
ncbi:MAG: sodium-dependent transporter [Prevotella sp.]|jgi:NSS family neurotransmitter:Na+ symporter|nr:sodium-dependent transporter [Prevotella sp.]MCH4182607.1 sodium-dependent transporter [Prevotella sp.]MCH4212316.1 sodium-dependent transporter [Prevotella sp.]MCH4240312.1 sodium-dependent transporter [Prevotella sp.]